MVKLSVIIPSSEFVATVRNTFNEHQFVINESIPKTEYKLNINIAPTIHDIQKDMLDSDIIIARGLIADHLEEKYSNLLVVRIPISSSEIIRAIFHGIQRNKESYAKIAVLGAHNMLYSATGLDTLLNVEILKYHQDSNKPEEIQKVLDKVSSDGCNIIICGYNTFQYAINSPHHYNCNQVLMSRESFSQAITEAKHVSKIRRREFENAVQHRAILDSAMEGILAVDRVGRIISINKVAGKILGIDESSAGEFLTNYIGKSKLNTIIRNMTEYTREIVSVQNKTIILNKHILYLRNDFIGSVVTFQETKTVQQDEYKIRNKIYLKGNEASYTFNDIIGQSELIQEAIQKAKEYSTVSSNIMINGETGTGKELFAQSIHNLSKRKAGPFVAINCAALSPSLLESELFGYSEGAFTGAIKGGKQGLFELAHSGTCFLDEISELPLGMQGKLLRVLQERQIRRLGDEKVVPIDIRIICATNKPLFIEVKNGNFRRDLYYRLNVLKLTIPPLRERKEDIIILMNMLITKFCHHFEKPPKKLSPEAADFVTELYWDGNVRELRNICECLTVTTHGEIIQKEDIEYLIMDSQYHNMLETCKKPQHLHKGNLEKYAIEKALVNYKTKTAAAHHLGISTSTLWRRMKKLNISE